MRNLLIIFILFLTGLSGSGQDALYSQFSNQIFLYNPALNGFSNNDQLSLSNRDQWRNNSKSLSTSAISYNKHLPWQIKKKSPLVLNTLILKDNLNNSLIIKNQILLSITSTVQLNNNFSLGTSLYAGIIQNNINYNHYKWGTQYNGFIYDPNIDSQEGFSKESFLNFDCGLSLIANFRGGYLNYKEKRFRTSIGYSLFHINTPRNTINMRYTDQYSRKVYFGSIAGRVFNNFRWMYMLMINKQGPDLLVMTGPECRYVFENENRSLKSVAFEIFTCHNKSYFANFIQSSFMTYNLYFDLKKISVGITYESETGFSTNKKASYFKAIECSIKYRFHSKEK